MTTTEFPRTGGERWCTGDGMVHGGRVPGEAVFVPADNGEGRLLTYVHDATTGRSDLVVDAGAVAAAPVATVHLPGRVPAGFHGNWLPDA